MNGAFIARRQALALALLLGGGLASAQSGAPVRLLVGYPAGGPVDSAARLVAPVLAREIGMPVVVDDRPGVPWVGGPEVLAAQAARDRDMWATVT